MIGPMAASSAPRWRRAGGVPPEAATHLYNWYRDGYVHADTA